MDTTYDGREGPYGTREVAAATDRAASHRILWIAGLVVLGLVVLALIWLLVRQNRPVIAQVQRRNIIHWESVAGDVVAPPNKYAVINCHCSAPVGRIFTSVGQTVHKGDIIVELSHPSAEANYEAARSEAAAARAAYNDAAGPLQTELTQARAQLAALQGAPHLPAMPPIEVPTGMDESGAAPAGAGAQTSPEGAGAKAGTPPAPPANDGARQLALQQQADALGQARVRVAEAEQAMRQELAPYRQRVQAADQALKEAEAGRSEAFIRSPIDGQVVELNAQPGQPISAVPNTLVATVADLASLKIHARLTEAQQGLVQAGMPVQVRVTQLPDQVFTGVVEQISAELGPQVAGAERELRQVAVVRFVNTQGLVKPDMSAQVLVETAELPWVLSVPNGAVQRDAQGQTFVEARSAGGWQRTPVQIGPSDGYYTAILSGLNEGQEVRVRPQHEREV